MFVDALKLNPLVTLLTHKRYALQTLIALWRFGPGTQAEVTRWTGANYATVMGIIKLLQKHELVMFDEPTDERSIGKVSLSRKGEGIARIIESCVTKLHNFIEASE